MGRGSKPVGFPCILSIAWHSVEGWCGGKRTTSDITCTRGLLPDLRICTEFRQCRADEGGVPLPWRDF